MAKSNPISNEKRAIIDSPGSPNCGAIHGDATTGAGSVCTAGAMFVAIKASVALCLPRRRLLVCGLRTQPVGARAQRVRDVYSGPECLG